MPRCFSYTKIFMIFAFVLTLYHHLLWLSILGIMGNRFFNCISLLLSHKDLYIGSIICLKMVVALSDILRLWMQLLSCYTLRFSTLEDSSETAFAFQFTVPISFTYLDVVQ